MICVFEASDNIEAHMILNLLEQEGIEGRINGEFLQGGMGELQAMGLARVMVHSEDENTARTIIATWDASQPKPVLAEVMPRDQRVFAAAMVGLVIGVMLGGWLASLFIRC